MGKKKKKLGIKTSKYFTKTCDTCGEEYPSFFTHCPHCGSRWDEHPQEDYKTKNIKIVAKITEDNFSEPIEKVSLIFSGDGGKKWYKVNMKDKEDFYEAEVKEVPEGVTLIYLIEVHLKNGEIIRENNQGKYYKYNVAISEEEEEEQEEQEQTEPKDSDPLEVLKPSAPKSKDVEEVPEQTPNSASSPKQEKEEEELKTCPKCNSKVKGHYIMCPICGYSFKNNSQ